MQVVPKGTPEKQARPRNDLHKIEMAAKAVKTDIRDWKTGVDREVWKRQRKGERKKVERRQSRRKK